MRLKTIPNVFAAYLKVILLSSVVASSISLWSACRSTSPEQSAPASASKASIETHHGCVSQSKQKDENSFQLIRVDDSTMDFTVPAGTNLSKNIKMLKSKNLGAALTFKGGSLSHIRPSPVWCDINWSKVFPKSGPYPVNIGSNSFGGVASFSVNGEVLTLEVPLRLAGGLLFGKTSPAGVKEFGNLPAPPPTNFFKSDAQSIEDIPDLKQQILAILQEIEAIYKNKFFTLTFKPEFVKNESKFVNKNDIMFEDASDLKQAAKNRYGSASKLAVEQVNYKQYEEALNIGLKKGAQKKMTIVVTPVPDPAAVFPTSWVVYGDAYLLAHELGHILGIAEEGYMHDEYPSDGLMNDEAAYVISGEFNKDLALRKFYQVDLNSMFANLLNQPHLKALGVGQPSDQATISRIFKQQRGSNYYSLSYEKKRKVVTDAVKRFFGPEVSAK